MYSIIFFNLGLSGLLLGRLLWLSYKLYCLHRDGWDLANNQLPGIAELKQNWALTSGLFAYSLVGTLSFIILL